MTLKYLFFGNYWQLMFRQSHSGLFGFVLASLLGVARRHGAGRGKIRSAGPARHSEFYEVRPLDSPDADASVLIAVHVGAQPLSGFKEIVNV